MYVTITKDYDVDGVLINGSTPKLSSLTSRGVCFAPNGRVDFDNATTLFADDSEPIQLNVAALGRSVVVCRGDVYFAGGTPAWCVHAETVTVYSCQTPFDVQCEGAVVDTKHVWSWSTDGYALLQRKPHDMSVTGAITTTIAVLLLSVVEAGVTVPAWVALDAACWAAMAAAVGGAPLSSTVISGVAVAVALAQRKTNGASLAATAVAPALAVVVSVSVPFYDIGAKPSTTLIAFTGVASAVAAGARGSLWVLPWVYQVVMFPLVEQSAAVDAREWWAVPSVAVLATASVAMLGLVAADARGDRSYYRYLGALRASSKVTNDFAASGGQLVSSAKSRELAGSFALL